MKTWWKSEYKNQKAFRLAAKTISKEREGLTPKEIRRHKTYKRAFSS